MNESFSVLIVCSANVCRSPYAHTLVGRWAAGIPSADEIVSGSAGVLAYPGDPMCPQAANRAGVDPFRHAARELTASQLLDADLIVTADREQRGAAARLAPPCRQRLFTLRQAAALGISLAPTLLSGAIPEGAPAPPRGATARLQWLVGEMDAARGLLAAQPESAADIVDRHGPGPHDDAFSEVATAVASLTAAFEACLSMR